MLTGAPVVVELLPVEEPSVVAAPVEVSVPACVPPVVGCTGPVEFAVVPAVVSVPEDEEEVSVAEVVVLPS
jgi:hypothetical protein